MNHNKAVKRTLLYINLPIERYINRNVVFQAVFANCFLTFLVDFSKADLSQRLLEKCLASFAITLARLLIYNFCKCD